MMVTQNIIFILNNIKRHLTGREKIITLSALIITLLFGGVLSFDFVSAMTYQNEINVQFTFEPSLSISLSSPNLIISNLVPGNYSNSNTITVDVTTNNIAGYTLTAKVGGTGQTAANNSLVNTISNTAFTSLGDSDNIILPNFSDNKWGFSTAASITDATTFSGLLYNEDKVINATANNDGAAATGYTVTNSTKFTIGAKASADQAAGDYTNVITFTAVTNVIEESLGECSSTETCMQTFTADMCEAQASDAPVTLTDARDGNTYTVRYLQGACWMTQNLRLTDTVSSQYSNFSTNSTFNPCVGDLTAGNSYDEARCHDSGSTETGVWYNCASASAGTITGDSNSTDATEDICPAGWHLPSRDMTKPAGSVNSLLDLPDKDYFSPVTGGRYYGGRISNTGNGYWWSSVADSTTARYYLFYDGSSLNTVVNSRYYGIYIRCVRL